MSGPVQCRYYGRDFTAKEMSVLRALIAETPPRNRFNLSKAFCRRIGWTKPDGKLKDMMARVTMLAMHKDGLIALPPPKWGRNPPVPIAFGPDTDAPLEAPPRSLDEVRPVRLQTVLGGTPQSKQWNAYIARYHHLGYKTLVGAQMRYTVHDRTTGTRNATSRKRPSGCSRSERTGNESSIAKHCQAAPRQPTPPQPHPPKPSESLYPSPSERTLTTVAVHCVDMGPPSRANVSH